MIEYIKEAANLNKEGVKLPSRKPKETKEIVIPVFFTQALGKNKKAFQPGSRCLQEY